MLLTLLLLLLMGLLAGHAGAVAAVLADRVNFCLQSLVPSLFGCMALANLLRRTGAGDLLGTVPARLMRIPASAAGIFLLSQIAGYPVGAMLLRQRADAGEISQADAARLSCVCFGGGPAFAAGFAGAGLLGSVRAGWLLLAACILANTVLAVPILHSMRAAAPVFPVPVRVQISPAHITGAVSDAMRALVQICGMVLLFGTVLTLSLDALPALPAPMRALLAACTDVTQLGAVTRCGLPYGILLPLCAALLSFGGICVHWQCLALGTSALRAGILLMMRLAAAILAALIMRAMLPLLPVPETAAVMQCGNLRTSVSQSGSVLPGLLIFCTGFPFLIKKD